MTDRETPRFRTHHYAAPMVDAAPPAAAQSDDEQLPETMQRVVLRRRPEGLLSWDDVELIEVPLPELADGEALLHNEVLAIDASVRSWLSPARGYLPPVELGEPVRCSSAGRVVASRCDAYAVGDVVTSLANWEQYSIVRDDLFTTWLSEPDPDYDVAGYLSLYGSTGCTAYIGMVEVGRVGEGDTVVVSAAAGATGSVAAQIAKLHGARVIGIAGSAEKCRWLTEELGLDGAIDHRNEDVAARLKELCPQRVDLFFDNVGGEVLDAVLSRLAMHARVVLCGAISGYNDAEKPPGPSNYLNLIQQRASMTGFLALDDVPRFGEIGEHLRRWVDEGRLHYTAHTFEGLEQSVDALNAMFTGANTGKIIIRM
jgi:NADPH-dependent curcumin reductase CurA